MLLNLINYKIAEEIMNNDLLIGKPLPNFELQTSNNNLLKAIDLKGKLKLIFIYPKNDINTKRFLQISYFCGIVGFAKWTPL